MWDQKKASQFLDEALRQSATGSGTSDRALERMSALAAPWASESRAAFRQALADAGWSPRRIRAAIREAERDETAAEWKRYAMTLDVGPAALAVGWGALIALLIGAPLWIGLAAGAMTAAFERLIPEAEDDQ